MKILIIEDDKDIAVSLQEGLSDSYAVDVTHTGNDGEFLAGVNDYDLIILDVMLPDSIGFDVCQRLREDDITVPILMLTGQADIDDKVKGLDAGADDYLTKPFSFAELSARVRALIRRSPNYTDDQLQVRDLSIDVAKQEVQRQGKLIELRRKEFNLLEYLMRNSGNVVTREMILQHVWDSTADPMTNTVDVHMKWLRDKIDRPFDKALIKTVHGLGYKIEDM